MDNKAELVGIYDFNDDAILIEMIINEFSDKINIDSFCIPDNKLPKSSWQVAYMEQYLNFDGTQKLCDTYCTPSEPTKPTRIAFFVFKTENFILSTSYGDFSLVNIKKIPDRLKKTIEFD